LFLIQKLNWPFVVIWKCTSSLGLETLVQTRKMEDKRRGDVEKQKMEEENNGKGGKSYYLYLTVHIPIIFFTFPGIVSDGINNSHVIN